VQEEALQREVLKVVPVRHMSVVPMVARMLVAEALAAAVSGGGGDADALQG
jgi:hypothetical protein